jgi:hypothetical protein
VNGCMKSGVDIKISTGVFFSACSRLTVIILFRGRINCSASLFPHQPLSIYRHALSIPFNSTGYSPVVSVSLLEHSGVSLAYAGLSSFSRLNFYSTVRVKFEINNKKESEIRGGGP